MIPFSQHIRLIKLISEKFKFIKHKYYASLCQFYCFKFSRARICLIGKLLQFNLNSSFYHDRHFIFSVLSAIRFIVSHNLQNAERVYIGQQKEIEIRQLSQRINFGNLVSRSSKSITNLRAGHDNLMKFGYSRRSIDYSDES